MKDLYLGVDERRACHVHLPPQQLEVVSCSGGVGDHDVGPAQSERRCKTGVPGLLALVTQQQQAAQTHVGVLRSVAGDVAHGQSHRERGLARGGGERGDELKVC